jgi:cellulose synthase/poly-beta-1,6-N-acetylglucosamine synthase-like glycosyltransferase
MGEMGRIEGMPGRARPLVSVVTPVYNGAEYLSECKESMRARRYQNWDYAIVDNCSTDRSAALVRRYAAINVRSRVQEGDHCPVPMANHNAALLQMAGGRWL